MAAELRMRRVQLMNTMREVHPNDLNIKSFNLLVDELQNKIYCQYRSGDEILDAFISRNLDGAIQIKFAKDLLGKLYTTNPWLEASDFTAKDELLIYPNLDDNE